MAWQHSFELIMFVHERHDTVVRRHQVPRASKTLLTLRECCFSRGQRCCFPPTKNVFKRNVRRRSFVSTIQTTTTSFTCHFVDNRLSTATTCNLYMEFKCRPSKRVRVPWPCLVCDKECRVACHKIKNVRSVECSMCSGWVHEICASMTPELFDYFSTDTSRYVCGLCISEDGLLRNKYSYSQGLRR